MYLIQTGDVNNMMAFRGMLFAFFAAGWYLLGIRIWGYSDWKLVMETWF